MIKLNNFFDMYWNRGGKGFQHHYERQRRKTAKVIMDYNAGLMWQQSGNQDEIFFSKALKYINRLNKRQFAGFNDWRIPTLEEAMSLMESVQKNDLFYLDPVFDRQQRWIWTCDPIKAEQGRWWVVSFVNGECDENDDVDNGNYVRAVRSVSSSDH